MTCKEIAKGDKDTYQLVRKAVKELGFELHRGKVTDFNAKDTAKIVKMLTANTSKKEKKPTEKKTEKKIEKKTEKKTEKKPLPKTTMKPKTTIVIKKEKKVLPKTKIEEKKEEVFFDDSPTGNEDEEIDTEADEEDETDE